MIIVIMGVTGCGKTTLGNVLARKLNIPFLDADQFHPPENREKLKQGKPLNDEDRHPWLKLLAGELSERGREGHVVLACSALKRSYRDILRENGHPTLFVHIDISKKEVLARVKKRAGSHELIKEEYEEIIDGQFRDLEPPESGITISGSIASEEAADQIAHQLPAEKERLKPEYFGIGGINYHVTEEKATNLLSAMLERIGNLHRVLIVPPDFTRLHSWAGELTVSLYHLLKKKGSSIDILPALGTHAPMTSMQINQVYPGIPHDCFHVHRWREDIVQLGEIPGEEIEELSGGLVNYPIPCEVNRMLLKEDYDRIFSIGQLVPHEVVGIANHSKNIFVGTGGKNTINRTHFLGAVCSMERMMGKTRTPVREVLNRMCERFGKNLPITYILTVRGVNDEGNLVTRGIYAGDGLGGYYRGAALSREVNLTTVERPLEKCVVYLNPDEYHSTWLGNKAVYRTRCAMADGGKLIVLAPGVRKFGEDPQIDRIIRKHGYRGTPCTMEAMKRDPLLQENLSAAAHLIHASSEGRFDITYAVSHLTRGEIEGVGYEYISLDEALENYPIDQLNEGWNQRNGEAVYYISNPALGLWSCER